MKEETRKLLEKAERALRASETLLNSGDPEFAAGRAYYAMLHAAQALLRERDLKYRKHAGVHGAFGENFVRTGLLDSRYHRWLLDAYDERLRGDYDINVSFEASSVSMRIEQAREFILKARSLIENS
ncbi:MAG: HEPN domain-containing protein [Candidatus Glassbacteria bacterium]